MRIITVEVESRELATTGDLNGLRRSGWVPAIVYGAQDKTADKNWLIKLNEKSFLKTMVGHKASNVILELKLGDKSTNAVIKEVQKNATTDHLIHIDFKRISMAEKLEVLVPLHLQGESVGVKMNGGILEHIARQIKVSCLPKDIPEVINIDIAKLDVGQSISVKDLPAIAGVEILTEPDHLIVHVVSQTVEEEVAATPVVAAAGKEPEVIAKGKKPEEGAVAATAAPAAKPGEKAAAPKGK